MPAPPSSITPAPMRGATPVFSTRLLKGENLVVGGAAWHLAAPGLAVMAAGGEDGGEGTVASGGTFLRRARNRGMEPRGTGLVGGATAGHRLLPPAGRRGVGGSGLQEEALQRLG